jgi:ATP-dependent DNA helicase DinG
VAHQFPHTDSIQDFATGLSFTAIDIETTGLDFKTCEIIEVSAVKFANNTAGTTFSSLVKPRHGLPKQIQFLTHIDPGDLANAPAVNSVLAELEKFLGDSVLVGHNVEFDLGFINHYLVKSGGMPLSNKYWDTSELARVYFPFVNDHKLGTMTKHFGIKLENAHRALADATATGYLMLAITSHATKHYSLITNARLFDFSRQAQHSESLHDYLSRLVEYQRRYALLGEKARPPQTHRPNVVEYTHSQTELRSMRDVFSLDGLLASRYPNFEFRNGQIQMAEAVQDCFKAERHLAVEAGTGVGKSFAYLVPSIQFAYTQKTRVVISTNTKNLQEQLFFKDIPQLGKMLPVDFKAALVKGRENYICERRWNEFLLEQARGISTYEARSLLYLFIWKILTQSGDISENSSFDRTRFNIVWRKICSDRYLCMGRKCPHAASCYVMRLRKHIEDSTIVVANHSLLLADIQMENSTLGEYGYLVVDEAHNLMNTATRHLGFSLGYPDVNSLLNQLAGTSKRKPGGFLHQIETALSRSLAAKGVKDHLQLLVRNIAVDVDILRKDSTVFFEEVASQVESAKSYGKLRIKNPAEYPVLRKHLSKLIEDWKNLMKNLQATANVISGIDSKQIPNYDTITDTLSAFFMHASETELRLLTLENPDLETHAYWMENEIKPERNVPSSTLNYAPVEVSGQLKTMLYDVVPSIVFTSATLAIRGSFRYFFNQSGLGLLEPDRIRETIVDSPFDYDHQSKLFVGSFLPEHKDRFFLNQALSCVEQLVLGTNVGTMILFTSYNDLNSVYDHLGDALYHRGRPFFAQGKAGSRSSILEQFKEHTNAVLLGTNSFWEGVDVQGESLSLLILFKLPFLVPSEPIVEAYIDKLERENKPSFMHYMLPNALLRLRQGFGRLIRSKSDRGVVLIMDSRVSNKQYGEYFKQVLPTTCTESRNELELISGISSFFMN